MYFSEIISRRLYRWKVPIPPDCNQAYLNGCLFYSCSSMFEHLTHIPGVVSLNLTRGLWTSISLTRYLAWHNFLPQLRIAHLGHVCNLANHSSVLSPDREGSCKIDPVWLAKGTINIFLYLQKSGRAMVRAGERTTERLGFGAGQYPDPQPQPKFRGRGRRHHFDRGRRPGRAVCLDLPLSRYVKFVMLQACFSINFNFSMRTNNLLIIH